MTKTIEQITAELASAKMAYEAAKRGIQRLRAIDRIQNEGGEGYSRYEDASEALYVEHQPAITALEKELFAATWTPEVTGERRAAWNASLSAVRAAKTPTAQHDALDALIARLGYSHHDIARAKAINNIA